MLNIDLVLLDVGAYNNTHCWTDGNILWIDSLKGIVNFEKTLAKYDLKPIRVYCPTRSELDAAWTGDGKSHNNEFGGRECFGFVYMAVLPQNVGKHDYHEVFNRMAHTFLNKI